MGQLSAQMPGSTLAPQALSILSPCSISIHMSSCGACLPPMPGPPWVPQYLSRLWLSLTGKCQVNKPIDISEAPSPGLGVRGFQRLGKESRLTAQPRTLEQAAPL